VAKAYMESGKVATEVKGPEPGTVSTATHSVIREESKKIHIEVAFKALSQTCNIPAVS
jgi:hypothetical protein